MADAKITELTELSATPANDDLIPVVDISENPDVTKKVTVNNLINANNAKCGVATRAMKGVDGNVTYAHGLGRIPKMVRITALRHSGDTIFAESFGAYDGSNTRCVWANGQYNNHSDSGSSTTYIVLIYSAVDQSEYSRATITVDATNITLSWTKSASPSGTITFMWEVE
jgi:hypothetical protein